MQITVTPAFATPIFSVQLPEFAAHRAGLIAAVEAEKARDPGLQLANRYGWHSQGNFHLKQEPDVVWLMDALGGFIQRALATLGPALGKADIMLSACWANAGGQGAWHAPHNHMPSHWSGAVYLAAEDCQAATGDLGGSIEFLNPYPMGMHYGQAPTSAFQPRDGMVLLFPAYLLHFVHPNRQPTTRISLSFNLELTLPG